MRRAFMSKLKIDLTGQRFGKWLVLYRDIEYKKAVKYICTCDCGVEKSIFSSNLIDGKSTSCHKCQNARTKHPISKFYSQVKASAKSRGLTFNLSREYMWDLFLQQNKKCVYTNLDLIICPWPDAAKSTASLDRIDSSKGYEIGNVQWVYKLINYMKWESSEQEFIKLCHLVAQKYPLQNQQ